MPERSTTPPIDAVVLVSFGGPERPDDVMAFLERVTGGRNIPAERLATVAAQYDSVGGVSPLNSQCRQIRDSLRAELQDRGRSLPVYWGNRNWTPLLDETVAEMAKDGVRHAVAIVTSAYSSYSGCRQYLDDIEAAREAVGSNAPMITKVRPYFNHPGFIGPFTESTIAALGQLTAPTPSTPLVFTAHSIPTAQAQTSDYETQLREAARLIVEGVGPSDRPWTLVWQSRSGPPSVPWLEPDINDELARLRNRGEQEAVIVPIGFVSDHMEVLFDLDVQAARTAAEIGINVERAVSPGTGPHSRFVEMLADLVEEHTLGRTPVALGSLGPRQSPCPNSCCPRHSPKG